MINKLKENINKLEKEIKTTKRKMISSILMVSFLLFLLLTGDSTIFKIFVTTICLIYIGVVFYFSKTLFDLNVELSYNKKTLYEYELNEMNKKIHDYFEYFKYKQQFYKKHYNTHKSNNQVITNQNVINSFKLFGLNTTDNEYKIKDRYRELVKKWHPDLFTNDTKENQEISKRNMQKVNNAYSVIKKYKNIK